MFKEPVLVVKSRRGSLKSLQQPSGSLVSAVLDSASSASPRIYPLDPGCCSIELLDLTCSSQQQHHNANNHSSCYTSSQNSTLHPISNNISQPGRNTSIFNVTSRTDDTTNPPANTTRNGLSRCVPTAPPHPSGSVDDEHEFPSATTTSSQHPLVRHTAAASLGLPRRASESASCVAKEARIVPEQTRGIGRRLLNGFYDEFLDGLPFRRRPASTCCDPPARRYSLMGRAGTARNSEFKRNPIAQHRQR